MTLRKLSSSAPRRHATHTLLGSTFSLLCSNIYSFFMTRKFRKHFIISICEFRFLLHITLLHTLQMIKATSFILLALSLRFHITASAPAPDGCSFVQGDTQKCFCFYQLLRNTACRSSHKSRIRACEISEGDLRRICGDNRKFCSLAPGWCEDKEEVANDINKECNGQCDMNTINSNLALFCAYSRCRKV